MSGLPQLLAGVPVAAPRWGVTRRQLAALLAQLRADPLWDPGDAVDKLVSDFIVPWTRGTGLGYALYINAEKPLQVNIMVSHAWKENAEEFLETLLRSSLDTDAMFICSLSLYQAEDGYGPSIQQQIGTNASGSPFKRVLNNIHSRQMSYRCGRYSRGLILRFILLCGLLSVLFMVLPAMKFRCTPGFGTCAFKEFSNTGSVPVLVVRELMEEPKQGNSTVGKLVLPDAGWSGQAAAGVSALPSLVWRWHQMGPSFVIFPVLSMGCIVCSLLGWLMLHISDIAFRGGMLVVPNRE